MTEIPTPTATVPAATERKRPTGITVLAAIWIIFNIISLIGSPGNIDLYGVLYAGYSVVVSIIGLILGIALWQMLPWARKAAIIWEIISLILGIVMSFLIASLFGGIFMMAMFIMMIPSSIIGLIIIGYLMQGSIKAAFEEKTISEAW
jgi:hypothetical protein